jgi:hypothetical protein
MRCATTTATWFLVILGLSIAGCTREDGEAAVSASPSVIGEPDSRLAARGTVEVTARLVEVPPGAIIRRELYDYATVLKYEVLAVHRGRLASEGLTTTIYVAQYNPFKPRRQAADRFVKGIGGNVGLFRGGDTHRMSLEVPVERHFMGAQINKYFSETRSPIYWAVWTDQARSPSIDD